MNPVLVVSSGEGPVEVRRFVRSLADHLARSCAERGASVLSIVHRGDPAAPRSVEIALSHAPAAVAALVGTHALVARSGERARRARKRWFAGVRLEDVPGEAPSGQTRARPEDIVMTACRAGGPGGQHVNKTNSAVRATHVPSGLTVRVDSERSQRENARIARERLDEALGAEARARLSRARSDLRASHYRVTRGAPVRVYELDEKGGIRPCEETCSR